MCVFINAAKKYEIIMHRSSAVSVAQFLGRVLDIIDIMQEGGEERERREREREKERERERDRDRDRDRDREKREERRESERERERAPCLFKATSTSPN